MLFQSLEFILFLLIIFLLYWNLPQRFRWILLLLAGYFYYAGFGMQYLLLLMGITLFAYFMGRFLESERLCAKSRMRKIVFAAAVLTELAVLIFFKMPRDSIILPVGISFYTFQTVAYLIDIYNGKREAEKHFGYFATSVAFFPILLSGPIERISGLVGQLKSDKTFSEQMAMAGVRQMLLGYFKKMIIADSLAVYVDAVYGSLADYRGFPMLLAIVVYSVQIYCDFSGYSDIAIGVAKLLGIHLTDNFKMPYLAVSMKDFWRRWHISLTSWFRDYVYIPLGGNRTSKMRNYGNILLTFCLSGLWHGQALHFLVWGGIHGLLQIFESVGKGKIKFKGNAVIKRIYVFAAASIAQVFFRAESVSDALYLLCHSADGILSPAKYLKQGYASLHMSVTQLVLLLFFIFLLAVYDYFAEKGLPKIFYRIYFKIPAAILVVELVLFYYCKYGSDSSAFVYFQF